MNLTNSSFRFLQLLGLIIGSIACAENAPADSNIKKAISLGMDGMNIMVLKTGEVIFLTKQHQIWSGGPDAMKGQFLPEWEAQYQTLQKCELITMTEVPIPKQQYESTLGSKRYEVRLTSLGEKKLSKELVASALRDVGFYGLKVGTYEVTEMIKDVEYNKPNLPQSETYRFVMGKYEYKPTEIGKVYWSMSGVTLKGIYKFRGVVKSNPFNNTYSLVKFDWGFLDKDGWETNFVD